MDRRPIFLGISVQTLIADKNGPIVTNRHPPWGRRENGDGNSVFLTAIMVWGLRHLASRGVGHIFVRIFQISRTAIHHFWGGPI